MKSWVLQLLKSCFSKLVDYRMKVKIVHRILIKKVNHIKKLMIRILIKKVNLIKKLPRRTNTNNKHHMKELVKQLTRSTIKTMKMPQTHTKKTPVPTKILTKRMMPQTHTKIMTPTPTKTPSQSHPPPNPPKKPYPPYHPSTTCN